MARWTLWAVLAMAACAEEEEPEDTDGVCGELTLHDATILGRVEDTSGAPTAAARVVLFDQGWLPGTNLGEATSDAEGRFRLEATDITATESCWGSVLRYELVATAGDLSGMKVVTSYIHEAIRGGTGEADLSTFPVVVE